MNAQLFDQHGAPTREARQEYAQAALDHADRVSPQWSDVAYKFLQNYARAHADLFTGEMVTAAAREWGLSEPPTTRAWGSLYRRAQNQNVIVWVDNNGKRYNGNATARYRRAA